jgi:hypothetical protein
MTWKIFAKEAQRKEKLKRSWDVNIVLLQFSVRNFVEEKKGKIN